MGTQRTLRSVREDKAAGEDGVESAAEAAGREDDPAAYAYGSWNLLDHFFLSPRPLFSLSGKIWNPPVNLSETADRVLIRMEIAGMRPPCLSVIIERGVLVIRGKRCDRAPQDAEEYHLMEIRHGCFERAFRIAGAIMEDQITASYHDGFLDVEIPKGPGQGKSVTILVKER